MDENTKLSKIAVEDAMINQTSVLVEFMDGNTKLSKKAVEEAKFEESIVSSIIKYSGGLIKNEIQASYALIALFVFLALLSFFLILGDRNGGVKSYSEDLINLE